MHGQIKCTFPLRHTPASATQKWNQIRAGEVAFNSKTKAISVLQPKQANCLLNNWVDFIADAYEDIRFFLLK